MERRIILHHAVLDLILVVTVPLGSASARLPGDADTE
jgi:hypothetical protein